MKVWINGCFDVLHYGHFQLIKYASLCGTELRVGIDSDRRVKLLKGSGRPYHTSEQRKENLLLIKGVSDVVVFDTDDELRNELREYQPDIFVIGTDYINKPIIGGECAKEILFFDRIEGLSTTKLLDE